jgi:hypothetical protein
MKREAAKTRRTQFWFDPRFAIGLALVVGSVVGVYAIVAGSDRTTPVYAARASLAVGDRIDPSDLVVARVRLDGSAGLYVTPDRLPGDGLVVTRTVTAGELLPLSAVGTTAGALVTSVVVDLQGKLAAAIQAGSVVDVWSARQGENQRFGPPSVLVGRASIVRIVESTGLITADNGQSVEILVPKDKVAAVLESIANGDAIAVVPVNTALGK